MNVCDPILIRSTRYLSRPVHNQISLLRLQTSTLPWTTSRVTLVRRGGDSPLTPQFPLNKYILEYFSNDYMLQVQCKIKVLTWRTTFHRTFGLYLCLETLGHVYLVSVSTWQRGTGVSTPTSLTDGTVWLDVSLSRPVTPWTLPPRGPPYSYCAFPDRKSQVDPRQNPSFYPDGVNPQTLQGFWRMSKSLNDLPGPLESFW